MSSDHFYRDLPVLDDFKDLTRAEDFHPVPDDWHIAFADIRGSTEAIENGRYKDVNNVGASSIMAIINAVKPLQIPYVFGGDGATLCVPGSVLKPVQRALCATQQMAKEAFGLDLRVGTLPVSQMRNLDGNVKIAKIRVSSVVTQAVFSGGGLTSAEALLKDPDRGREFLIDANIVGVEGDFSGLECRWDMIKSPHEETITLMVQATSPDPERNARVYSETLLKIAELFGSESEHHPIRPHLMNLTRSNRQLMNEFKVRTWGRDLFSRVHYWFDLWVQQIIGWFVVDSKSQFAGVDWGRYKTDFVANSDYRKFDDVLRYVLSGKTSQREALDHYLRTRYRKGELVYGIHTAPGALVTCMIFNYNQEHLHFVDGGNGGYALAAKQMKEQLQAARAANT